MFHGMKKKMNQIEKSTVLVLKWLNLYLMIHYIYHGKIELRTVSSDGRQWV